MSDDHAAKHHTTQTEGYPCAVCGKLLPFKPEKGLMVVKGDYIQLGERHGQIFMAICRNCADGIIVNMSKADEIATKLMKNG